MGRWVLFSAILLSYSSAWAEHVYEPKGARLVADSLPAGVSEFTNIYSRGNDDTEEKDENGETNYETARHRVTLRTVRDLTTGEIRVEMQYKAAIVNFDGRPQARNYGLRDAKNDITGTDIFQQIRDKKEPAVIWEQTKYTKDRDAFLPDAPTVTGLLDLGKIPKGANKTYTGYIGIQPNPKEQGPANFGLVNQYIKWTIVVENGRVKSATADLNQRMAEGKDRRGSEFLRRLDSSYDDPKLFEKPFPKKNGKAEGAAKIG